MKKVEVLKLTIDTLAILKKSGFFLFRYRGSPMVGKKTSFAGRFLEIAEG